MLPGAEELLVAFWELSNDRPYLSGMAVSPLGIPASSIDWYARRFGYDNLDEYDMLVKAIRACDEAYLKHHNREAGEE